MAKLMNSLAKLVVAAGLVASMAACSATHKSADKVDCSTQCVDGTNTVVVRNPQGFRNVMITCYGTTGLYVTSRGNSLDAPTSSDLEVILNDPRCTATPKPTVGTPTVTPSR